MRVLALFLIAASTSFAQDEPEMMLGEGQPWETPIYVNDSGVDGPTVIVTGGIHGNEPAGAASAEQIRHWPIARGKLIVIPRVNTAGLDANIRYIPKAVELQKDLNRNFPSPGIADEPRGEIATALWQFVVAQNPDWLFDLHEGYEFNISHKPKPGKTKSVGSSIIYDRTQQLDPMVERMLTAANGTVSNPDRMFVLRGRGPKKTGLASAVIHVLKKRAMILETTYEFQALSIRTRQQRSMMAVALRHLDMIDQTPERLDEFTLVRDAKAAGIKNYVPPTFPDVYYGKHERQVLDFWKAKSDTPTPVVFVIHGGSWTSGSKSRIFNYLNVRRLLEGGCSVASINYRYVTQAPKDSERPPVRTPLYDAARALQFIRSQAKAWNVDKTRIGASGASAGACTSLWLAYHDDLADPDSSDPVARESTRLTCVAVSGAQTTLDPKQMKQWTPNSRYGGHAFGLGKFDEFLTKRESILPWIQEYSPYANVTSDDPPVALFYKHAPAIGKPAKDPTHTGNFGIKLQEHCKDVGVECYLYYTGLRDPKYTSKTSYLIERLNGK